MSTHRSRLLFVGLYYCARTLERAASLLGYAVAGAARLADLRAAIQHEWDSPLADSENYVGSALMAWEREFYPAFLKPDDRVLLIGCGTGRDLLGLRELGYRVEGLDLGSWCTARARALLQSRGFEALVYTGGIETEEVPGPFDAFIFSWFCYSYIPQSSRRIEVLRKLRQQLTPGGRILLTYELARTVPRRLTIRLGRLVGRLTASDWRLEYGDVVRIGNSGRYFEHYEHKFTPAEFEQEARAAGFTVAFHQDADIGRAVLTT